MDVQTEKAINKLTKKIKDIEADLEFYSRNFGVAIANNNSRLTKQEKLIEEISKKPKS